MCVVRFVRMAWPGGWKWSEVAQWNGPNDGSCRSRVYMYYTYMQGVHVAQPNSVGSKCENVSTALR